MLSLAGMSCTVSLTAAATPPASLQATSQAVNRRDAVSVSTHRPRDGLETQFQNVSSRSRTSFFVYKSSNKYFSYCFPWHLIACMSNRFIQLTKLHRIVVTSVSYFDVLLIEFALLSHWYQTMKLYVITMYLLLDNNGWGSSLKALNRSWITKMTGRLMMIVFINVVKFGYANYKINQTTECCIYQTISSDCCDYLQTRVYIYKLS